jgi:hypothetical protein
MDIKKIIEQEVNKFLEEEQGIPAPQKQPAADEDAEAKKKADEEKKKRLAIIARKNLALAQAIRNEVAAQLEDYTETIKRVGDIQKYVDALRAAIPERFPNKQKYPDLTKRLEAILQFLKMNSTDGKGGVDRVRVAKVLQKFASPTQSQSKPSAKPAEQAASTAAAKTTGGGGDINVFTFKDIQTFNDWVAKQKPETLANKTFAVKASRDENYVVKYGADGKPMGTPEKTKVTSPAQSATATQLTQEKPAVSASKKGFTRENPLTDAEYQAFKANPPRGMFTIYRLSPDGKTLYNAEFEGGRYAGGGNLGSPLKESKELRGMIIKELMALLK